MPLVSSKLKTNIQTFSDELSVLFKGFPNNITENAEEWANAIDEYAKTIVPVPTTTIAAKNAFLAVMSGLKEPFQTKAANIPLTIGYRSPESNLKDFNSYLNKIGYKSDPRLDRSQTFLLLDRIRLQYNKLYPIKELTSDEIKYNQSRFNEIYKNQIDAKIKLPIDSNGNVLDYSLVKNVRIPTSKDGTIIALQVDGIIGDDTIRYFPDITTYFYQIRGNRTWNSVYSTIPYIIQPNSSGEVSSCIIKKDNNSDYILTPISDFQFKRDFIEKGLSKNYSNIVLDTSQSQIDGGRFKDKVDSPFNEDINYFKKIFEINHAKHNVFWKTNSISSIEQLLLFLKIPEKAYNLVPSVQKDGLSLLENSILAYSQQLAIAMQPAFTAVPPTIPLTLKSVTPLGLSGVPAEKCVDLIVNIIHAWFKTGTAVNNVSGATTNWN